MGGLDEDGSQLIVTAEGNIVRTSNVMRQAAVVNGGLIYAARGPLSAAFVKANGAPGAISFQLDLGRAMLDSNGTERIPATVAFLKGEHLMTGKVTEMKFSNPHSWIYIDVETNGKIVNWALETGGANALIRRGWKKTDLPAGTVLVVDGWQARNGSATANVSSVTFPDGRRLFAGSSNESAPAK